MNPQTPGKDRVKAHRLRQKKAGLVEVRVWVPKDGVEKIRVLAAKLVKSFVRK